MRFIKRWNSSNSSGRNTHHASSRWFSGPSSTTSQSHHHHRRRNLLLLLVGLPLCVLLLLVWWRPTEFHGSSEAPQQLDDSINRHTRSTGKKSPHRQEGAASVPPSSVQEVDRLLYLDSTRRLAVPPQTVRAVKREALDQYYQARRTFVQPKQEETNNDVEVDQDDLDRAERNLIGPLPQLTLAVLPPSGLQASEGDVSRRLRWVLSWPSSRESVLPSSSWEGTVSASPRHAHDSLVHSTYWYNWIAPYLQEVLLDAEPIILDSGCVVGQALSVGHRNATVVCLVPYRVRDHRYSQEGWTVHDSSSSNSGDHPREVVGGGEPQQQEVPPKNLIWLTTNPSRTDADEAQHASYETSQFLDASFAQLYSLCQFSTAAMHLYALPAVYSAIRQHESVGSSSRHGEVSLARSIEAIRADTLRLAFQLIPSTATLFVAVPYHQNERRARKPGGQQQEEDEPLKEEDCEQFSARFAEEADRSRNSEQHERSENQPKTIFRCQVVSVSTVRHHAVPKEQGTVSATSSVVIVLLRIVLEYSRRACRKTWDAPLVQWDRRVTVTFDHGAVSFQVSSKKKALSRAIHPLQFIHSFNLDAMLAAQLDAQVRWRLLGQMIQTPRYSDPMPHNWVVKGRGEVVRIDKVDKRYDAAVDESLGYWGHSTRGYLHFLTKHLCLPLSPNGLPRVSSASCASRCRQCAKNCSYLPKASRPCAECLQCGACVAGEAEQTTPGAVQKCRLTYDSMHGARKEWKKWEKSDSKHSL